MTISTSLDCTFKWINGQQINGNGERERKAGNSHVEIP